MVVFEFGSLSPCTMSTGVLLSTSLLGLSSLFAGDSGWVWIEEGFKLMHIIVWKTWSKISASCEENKDQNGPSIPNIFFNDCRLIRMLYTGSVQMYRKNETIKNQPLQFL